MGSMIAKVFAFLMGTFAVWVLLLIPAIPVAHRLLPCDVDQTTRETCRVNDYPSNYELTSEDGSVLGEFNTWHAVLYVLAQLDDENVSLQSTPRELDLLAFGSLYGLAFFITLLAFSLVPALRGPKTAGGGGMTNHGLEKPVQTHQTYCAECGAMMPALSRFCHKCGSAVVSVIEEQQRQSRGLSEGIR